MGAFGHSTLQIKQIIVRSTIATKNRKHKKVNGSAKGKPYLAEINPLAQKKTNKAEAAAVILGDISFF